MKSKLVKASVLSLGLLAASTASAFALADNVNTSDLEEIQIQSQSAPGNGFKMNGMMGKRMKKFGMGEENGPKHLDEMKQLIANNDYEGWVKLMTEKFPDLTDKMTRENFDRMAEIHKLMEAGDKEGVKALMDELKADLPFPIHGKGHGKFGEMHGEMKEFIVNNDYEGWVKFMAEKFPKMSENFTQEHFDKMVEIHKLIESGDKEGAKKLMEEGRLLKKG